MGELTALKVKALKAPGRYGDGRGLMLVISGDGSRKWVLRIQASGRRRDVGLGAVADVTLAEARDAADAMRKAFKAGRDGVAERKAKTATPRTFEEAARLVHAEHAPGWRNPKHAAQWLSTLEAYAFPKFGDRPVGAIDAGMIRDALAEIWLAKPETARRVRQRIGTVLDYAYAKGWRDSDAPMRAVGRGLPRQPRKDRHFAAMRWQDVPGFVAGLGALKSGEAVRLALEFIILTAARSGEVRGATWREVDLDAKVWTVPAERMKGRRTHRVPLSARAVAILQRMGELRRTDDPDAHIFEGKPGRSISDMTLTRSLRRAGVAVTVHGFRSAFRDRCGEATATPREVAEAALAHVLANRVEAAYARTDHFDKRRALMDEWSKYASGPKR